MYPPFLLPCLPPSFLPSLPPFFPPSLPFIYTPPHSPPNPNPPTHTHTHPHPIHTHAPPLPHTVKNEVPLGYVEVSVHHKALTKKARAAGRPVILYRFTGGGEGGGQGGREGMRGGGGEESSPVSLDPLGLEALTETLQTALITHSCLSSLSLPLLFRRVDRFPEADIFIRYSSPACSSPPSSSSSSPSPPPGHRYFRTLTIPLRFNLKEGLSTMDLSVETAATHIYPPLARAIESAHRGAWGRKGEGREGGREGGMREMDAIDTDGAECFLLVEVKNMAGEDLHVKACLVDGEEGGEEGREEGKEEASASPMRKLRLTQQSPLPPPSSPPPSPPPPHPLSPLLPSSPPPTKPSPPRSPSSSHPPSHPPPSSSAPTPPAES